MWVGRNWSSNFSQSRLMDTCHWGWSISSPDVLYDTLVWKLLEFASFSSLQIEWDLSAPIFFIHDELLHLIQHFGKGKDCLLRGLYFRYIKTCTWGRIVRQWTLCRFVIPQDFNAWLGSSETVQTTICLYRKQYSGLVKAFHFSNAAN